MPFVSSYYEVLGKDVMDWMTWPANGIAIAIPLGLIGSGLSYIWPPFTWLPLVALGIVFFASAYVLVFLAAAGVQVLRNQLEYGAERIVPPAPPLFVRVIQRVSLKAWIVASCGPAALSLPVFAWGVFRFDDLIMLVGAGLFLAPMFILLTLAAITRAVFRGGVRGG